MTPIRCASHRLYQRDVKRVGKALIGLGLLTSCGAPQEAALVSLPVVVADSGITEVMTDLGYRVELREARMVLSDLVFAIAGESHAASFWHRASSWLLPTAQAHPGHYQGGEITGELKGRFLVNWLPETEQLARGNKLFQKACVECHGASAEGNTGPAIGGHPSIAGIVAAGRGDMPAFGFSAAELASLQMYVSQQLGEATLIEGLYHSANFTFSKGNEGDDLDPSDVLLHNTATLRGTATKADTAIDFLVVLTSDDNRQLVGATFESHVSKGTHQQLELRLLTKDPFENDTLFDGIDFSTLDLDHDGTVTLTQPGTGLATTDAGANTADGGIAAGQELLSNAYNRLKRTFQTHDHFDIHAVASSSR
jgi:hypothetical protein